MSQLPASGTVPGTVRFPSWAAFIVAAGLMILGVGLTLQIRSLKLQLATARADAEHLKESNALVGLRLVALDAKDASYASARVVVAWDPYRHAGVVSQQNLPAPPAGDVYQLWVLDPAAPAPLNAGVLTPETGSRGFAVPPVSLSGPGFAVSLEPTGDRPEPTGTILFAVAPGQ